MQPYENSTPATYMPQNIAPTPPSQQSKTPLSPKLRFFIFALLGALSAAMIVLALILTGVFTTSSKYEGSGFSSPEQAALAFANAMQDGNAEKMLSTFAIETAAESFKFEEYYLHQDFNCDESLSSWAALPTDTDFGYDLAVQRRAAIVAQYVVEPFFMAKEGAFEDIESYYENSDYVQLRTEEERKEFFEEYRTFDAENCFSDIQILGAYTNPVLDSYPEKYRERLDQQFDALGAESFAEMYVEFAMDGEVYVIGLTTACFDGQWYNMFTYRDGYSFINEKEG
ncbi:MAG: hypothetical protein E7434_06465 [Ruminococcaceae bacterium]|nr:hypothetical protein [Oscillospiraceae bacterium]